MCFLLQYGFISHVTIPSVGCWQQRRYTNTRHQNWLSLNIPASGDFSAALLSQYEPSLFGPQPTDSDYIRGYVFINLEGSILENSAGLPSQKSRIPRMSVGLDSLKPLSLGVSDAIQRSLMRLQGPQQYLQETVFAGWGLQRSPMRMQWRGNAE